MNPTLNPIAFQALCELNIYFWADLAWPSVRKASCRRERLRILQANGLLREVKDVESAAHAVQELYAEAIECYADTKLGDAWYASHDRWGARCFKRNEPPHHDILAGDDLGRYMTFDGLAALEEYTSRRLKELNS